MDLNKVKGILLFTLCLISVPGRGARQVKAFINGGLLIVCKFDDQHKDRHKYFCKGDVSTCPYNQLSHNNDSRVSRYENAQGDYLTILITNLTVDDAGTYHCGVEDGDKHHEIILSLESGDCCDPLITITGQEGGDINFNCKYPEELKDNVKHFCKQNQMNIESDLLQSKPSDTSLKFSLHDNKSASVFTVTIHKLDINDAGIYWCGVRTGQGDVALTTQVILIIPVTGRKKNAVFLKGFTMGGILILCKFSSKDKDKQKYFCKGDLTTCHSSRLTHNNDSRFVQYYHEQKNHLAVLLTNLTTEDAGIYHCAAEDGESHTAFILKIKEVVCCDPPVSTLALEGGIITIQCKYPEETKINVKHFYKQHQEFTDLIDSKLLYKDSKYSLFDNKSENIFTVTIHNLEKNDAGIYWCGVRTGGSNVALTQQVKLHVLITEVRRSSASILILSALLVVGLTIAVWMCYKCRRDEAAGFMPPLQSQEIVGMSCMDYENDLQGLASSNLQVSSDYQNLNPNATQRDDAVYQSLNPNTNQPDAVYQSLNPNTTLPDAVYQSLNPNTTQPDAVYQSLNPNTTQPDTVYQSLNPNTTQPDAVC